LGPAGLGYDPDVKTFYDYPLIIVKRIYNYFRLLSMVSIRKIRDIQHHRMHRKHAFRILASLEKQIGKLSKNEKLDCDNYARQVLGSKKYAPWLYVYTKNQGQFKRGWIPDNYYGKVVLPNIKGEYGKIASFKSLQFFILKSELLNDLVSSINGQYFTRNLDWIEPSKVKEYLFQKVPQVVFKEDNSLQGLGVHILDSESFNIDQISKYGNGVFQGFVHQHETLSRFDPGSVATLRITTTNFKGVVKVRGAFLRIGRQGDRHIISKSALKVPVDTVTGQLGADGYLPTWKKLLFHPDSKIEFAGTVVPAFDKAIKSVKELHSQVPFNGCVGWDLTVDQNSNVWLLEWNGGHNDIRFVEATQGPIFVDLNWESFSLKA